MIPTRKAIHQSDVVNRPYDMTESTLSVQIFLYANFCFVFFIDSHVVRERSESKNNKCTVGRPCSLSSFIPRRAPLIK